VHADGIQLFGSTHTVIKGNYFHDDADAIMAADGADQEDIENNVIGLTDNPTAITLYSDNSSVVRHNTFSDVGCTNDVNCGVLAVGNKDGDPPGQNTTVMDNIVGDVSASEGTATFAYLGFNFNMIGYGELLAGSSNFAGSPTFAGGTLATVNDFALAPASPGTSAASDGKDVGANGFPWKWATGPVVAGAKSPTIASHADMKFDATSPDGRVVSYTQPAALDGNGNPLTPDCWPHPGATFPLDDPEPMTVTCIATASGKIAVTQFHVSILDTTAPQITVPGDLTREATGSAGAVVTYPHPTAHDLVDGDIEPTCDRQPGAVFPLGRTTVTCTAADAHHHVASKQFVVTVKDTTPPALHGLPAEMRVTAAPGATGAVVRYTLPTATDVVDGGRPVACAPASGALFAVGATVVTCRAGDKAGNTAAGRFTVTVGQLPSGAAAIASARAKGAGVTVGLYCPAGTSGCTAVNVRLAVSARLKHGKVVRLGASGHRTILVGASAPRTIAAGQTVKLRVKLNRTGRALLKRFHRMKVAVRVSTGRSAAATRRITLKAPRRGH